MASSHFRDKQAEVAGEGFLRTLLEEYEFSWVHVEQDGIHMVLAPKDGSRRLKHVTIEGASAAAALITEHELTLA